MSSHTTSLAVLIAGSIALTGALAGCPSDGKNPTTLWLAPQNGETTVTLIDHAPPVY